MAIVTNRRKLMDNVWDQNIKSKCLQSTGFQPPTIVIYDVSHLMKFIRKVYILVVLFAEM